MRVWGLILIVAFPIVANAQTFQLKGFVGDTTGAAL
jgi:hypothetical protein